MPRPPHSSRFYHLQKLGEEYRSWSSSLCSFLHPPLTLSVLGTNILLNTLFSNTLSLRSSLVSDQVSHPHKTTGKIIVLYTVIFQFLDSTLEDSVPNDSMHSLTSICSNFFLNITLICWNCSQIFELFNHFRGTIISLCTVTSSCILIWPWT